MLWLEEDLARATGQDHAWRIVGFQVIRSEETPGLGERVKDQRPAYTWAELLAGQASDPGPDRTLYLRSFRGWPAARLRADGLADAVTSATMTTNGVIAALKDAQKKLTGGAAGTPNILYVP